MTLPAAASAPAIVHPSSFIEDGAVLGANVVIGPFCHVGPQVVLGDNVRLISHVVVAGRTTIGAGCRIFRRPSSAANRRTSITRARTPSSSLVKTAPSAKA